MNELTSSIDDPKRDSHVRVAGSIFSAVVLEDRAVAVASVGLHLRRRCCGRRPCGLCGNHLVVDV